MPNLFTAPLHRLFHELQSWTKADPAVAAQVLPDLVSAALSESLNKVPPDRVSSLPAAKPGLERVSVATFVVALCILAMQVNVPCFRCSACMDILDKLILLKASQIRFQTILHSCYRFALQ